MGRSKIFINGLIYSIDNKNNVYEAMKVEDGIIVELGNNEDVIKDKNIDTEVVNLNNKIVLPGFIDSNSYLYNKFIMRDDDLSLFDLGNETEYLEKIEEYIADHPKKKLIYGIGWKNEKFIYKSNKEMFKGPNKRWLNQIKTDKAIVLRDHSNNVLLLNDKALEYFKITNKTKAPVGGIIEKDEDGELWGTLKRTAMNLVDIKKFEYYSENDYMNALIKYQNKLHSYGITTISPSIECNLSIPIYTYRELESANKLKLRINYGMEIKPYEICKKSIYEQLHELKRSRIIYKSDLIDISNTDFIADGIIGFAESYLFKSYKFMNTDIELKGTFGWDLYEFKEAVKMANRLEFNACIYARGDNACRLSIDAIEYSRRNNFTDNFRNSLVHLDLISRYYMRRMKLLNIIAIIQPFWFYKNSSENKQEVLGIGEERIQRLYPFKSLINEGIVTASSSDYYVADMINPLNAIRCAVIRNLHDFIATTTKYSAEFDMNNSYYRLNPYERVEILDSIKSFTINAAYILGKEKEIGSLEIDKKGDFVVLNKNIFELDPLDLENVNVEKTYFNGELVYSDKEKDKKLDYK